MHKIIWFFIVSVLIAAFSIAYASNFDVSNLVKVTNDNNPKCVVYYHYQNEIYCSLTAPAAEKPDPQILSYEKQKIIFDNRPWSAAWGQKKDDITTVEYVPAGDNINSWHELITSQFIPGIQDKMTPLEFSESILNSLKQAGYTPEVTYMEKSPDRVIFEFRITSPENMMQDELQLISKGKDGLYILHYVIKKADMGTANRDKWLQNLKNSSLIEH